MSVGGPLVIVGSGCAGVELAFAVRQGGWTSPIVMVGDEKELPYDRPPLSKAYMEEGAAADSLVLRPLSSYKEAGVTLRLGVRVLHIDRAGHTLSLSDGTSLHYGKLALCTGGRPRLPAFRGMPEGAVPANLHVLRTRDDADGIRAALTPGVRLVVIGGGYVGLEIAAAARKRGAKVTVLESQPRVLARVTGAVMSDFYERVHRREGVAIHTGVTVEGIRCDESGLVTAVLCGAAGEFPADVLVVGIGMEANTALAEQAGLTVDGGILVDELSRTSDPDILAAGDCTVQDSVAYGRRIRLESVPNAIEQARAAASLLCGKPKPNRSTPWFWSNQYDLKLQMVGLSHDHDGCVVRQAPGDDGPIAFYLRQGRLIAADAVNRPADFMMAKRMVAAQLKVDAERLADPAVPLKDLLVASDLRKSA
ncbi:NAD(P)-binding protein [Azospirillum sp. INR13]|nr:NAD(P)-binding protein [Azospirillum sp. INR13]